MVQKPNINTNFASSYTSSTFNNGNINRLNNDNFNLNVNINSYDKIDEIDYSNDAFPELTTDMIREEKIKWNKIKLERERQERVKFTIYDKEAISSTKTGYIANYLEDLDLTDGEYKLLLEYLKGKKISDIFDENGKFKPINSNDLFFLDNGTNSSNLPPLFGTFNFGWESVLNNSIKVICDSINSKIADKLKNKTFNIDETCKDYIIEDVIMDESGYSAVVFKDDMGNYVLSSSPTNANSEEDLNAILYSMIDYIYGDETLAEYLPSIIFHKLGFEINGTSKDVYMSQINACYDLMEKYAAKAGEEGTKLNISGYSLGGGITLAAYGVFQQNEKDLQNNIANVSVYNAFLQYVDQIFSDDKYNGCLGRIKNDDRVRIFSSEGDIVSIFNDYVIKLDDKIEFLPAPELTELMETIDIGSEKITLSASVILDLMNIIKKYPSNEERLEQIIKLSSNVGVDPEKLKKLIENPDVIKEIIENNLSTYYKILFQKEGNHGYNYDDNIFDENGNMVAEGNYINVNDLFALITGREYTGNMESPDMDFILQNSVDGILGIPSEIIFDYLIGESSLSLNNIPSGITLSDVNADFDIQGIDISKLNLKPIIDLLYNPTQFSSSKLVDTFTKSICDWLKTSDLKEYLKKKINNKTLSFLIDNVSDEELDKLINSVATVIKDKDNYELTIQILFSFMNGYESTGMDILINQLIKPNLLFIVQENMEMLKNIVCTKILSKVSDTDIKILWINTKVSLRDCLKSIVTSVIDDLASDLSNSLDNSILNDVLSMAESGEIDFDKMDKIVDQLAKNNNIKPSVLMFEMPNTLDFVIGAYWVYRGVSFAYDEVTDFIGDAGEFFDDLFDWN